MIKIERVTTGMLTKKKHVYVEDKLEGNKAIKKDSLQNLTITVTSGKVFYADPESRQDISDAIALSTANGLTETQWKLSEEFDGERIVIVSIEELQEVLHKALLHKAGLVGIPNESD